MSRDRAKLTFDLQRQIRKLEKELSMFEFDHEKMSEKDQERYAEEMSAAIKADKLNCDICHQPNGQHKMDCGQPSLDNITIRERIERTFNDLDEVERRRTEAQKPRGKRLGS